MADRTALVLVHGSGDTGGVWRRVVDALDRPAFTPDLPGRGRRPADLTRLDPRTTARDIASEVLAARPSAVVVVVHSAAGVLGPLLAASLGAAARHVVFVAGLVAPEGGQAVDLIRPPRRESLETRRDEMLERWRGHCLVTRSDLAHGVELPDGLQPLTDHRVAQAIDTMTLVFEPFTWAGVGSDVGRTYVRCRHDQLQPPEMQDLLVAASGAPEVVVLDSGHTPARDCPGALAALLDGVAARYDAA